MITKQFLNIWLLSVNIRNFKEILLIFLILHLWWDANPISRYLLHVTRRSYLGSLRAAVGIAMPDINKGGPRKMLGASGSLRGWELYGLVSGRVRSGYWASVSEKLCFKICESVWRSVIRESFWWSFFWEPVSMFVSACRAVLGIILSYQIGVGTVWLTKSVDHEG